MEPTEEDLKFDWECWGDTKPWYCPKCNTLLASDAYPFCDGTDLEISEEDWTPHDKIFASNPVTFEEFCSIQKKWNRQRVNSRNEQ